MANINKKLKKLFRRQPSAWLQKLNRGKRIFDGHAPIVKDWPLRNELIESALDDFQETSTRMLNEAKRPFDTGELKGAKRRIAWIRYSTWYHWLVWRARLKIAWLAVLFGIGITVKTIVEFIIAIIKAVVNFFIELMMMIGRFVKAYWGRMLWMASLFLFMYLIYKMITYYG